MAPRTDVLRKIAALHMGPAADGAIIAQLQLACGHRQRLTIAAGDEIVHAGDFVPCEVCADPTSDAITCLTVEWPDGPEAVDLIDLWPGGWAGREPDGRMAIRFAAPFADLVLYDGAAFDEATATRLRAALAHFGGRPTRVM